MNFHTCTNCNLHKTRRLQVSDRGCLESKVDILFIGEGPGKSEDVLGKVFVGRSGKLLDCAIKDAGIDMKRIRISNLVQCRPTDSLKGDNRQPTESEVAVCSTRLTRVYEKCQPTFVIALGKIPTKYIPKAWKAIPLDHPSYILRCGGVSCPVYWKFVSKLREIGNAL